MICYRDRAYCNANCSVNACLKKYTPKVQADAEKWWGSKEAPIALSDFSQACTDFKEKKK